MESVVLSESEDTNLECVNFKPLSCAERCKRWREKHRAEVNLKNRDRMRGVRKLKRLQMAKDSVLKEEYRRKERERKRIYRERKKTTEIDCQTPKKKPYKSPQSFGKALRKVISSLPKSPSKKKAVLHHLCDVKINEKPNIGNKQKDRPALYESSHQSNKKVLDFFFRPDIVYTCPGLKDEITVWENGKKIKLRKMYLTMFLKEAYILFKQDNPEIEVGFSTFCKLRPKNVLLMHQTPSDQCKCLTCENFFLKLRALNIDYQEFWKTYLCNDSLDSSCWKGFCSNCCAGNKLETSVDHNKEKIKMKQWFKVENKPTCKDDVYTKAEIFGMLQNSFNSVSTHINTKRIQSEAFLSDKTDAKVRVLQLDFAMNYSCEYQNEIQSALWTRGSVCLFTAASIHNNECQTFAICSDTSTKDKNTIACFIKHLYENELLAVPEMWDDVEEVIWTDGPSSEFKNRYMVYLCQQLSLQFKKPFTWKYFATSHGKGIVDGVGGRIKSIVRTSVMSKKKDAPIVQNAKEFADVAKKLMKNTKIHLILESEISRDDSVWIKAKKVDGISKAHVVHCNGRTVNVYNNSYEQKADQSHAKCRPMHSSSKVRKSIFHLVFSDSESEQSGEWSQLDDNFSEEDLNSELPETQGNQVKTNVEVDNVKNGTFFISRI